MAKTQTKQLIYELETTRVFCVGSYNQQWLVQFYKMSPDRRRKMLDQIAAYDPRSGGWDQKRWSPVGAPQVPGAVLRQVEEWLARQGMPHG